MDFDLSWILLGLPLAFALGWLAHERDGAIARCVRALTRLRRADVFWD